MDEHDLEDSRELIGDSSIKASKGTGGCAVSGRITSTVGGQSSAQVATTAAMTPASGFRSPASAAVIAA
jgi:hypothetical protein